MRYIPFFLLLVSSIGLAQNNQQNDTTLNNLIHPAGYPAVNYGSIPEYVKAGKGKKVMVLIPGTGFDASVFSDFIEANKNEYTMYAITVPGFGSTHAPAMPGDTVSYGELTWSRSAVLGIVKLIEKEKLHKPVIVGHFITGTQIAMRFVIDFPEKVDRLIILGGSAKMMAIMQGKLVDSALKDMIKGTDSYWAPQWFKHMTKSFYDQGNFTPEIYSLNEATAYNLWNQVANTPMQVIVRYNCEYFASDVIAEAEMDKVKCPVLVIRGVFNDSMLGNPMNKNWIQPQFIESWNVAAKRNPSIKIVDVYESATFVWKDKPEEVYKALKEFVYSK